MICAPSISPLEDAAQAAADIRPFMRLGRPGLTLPRIYKALMDDAQMNAAYVRRAIKQEELFDIFVSESEDSALWLRLQPWLQALCNLMGLAWEPGLVASPTFLEFRGVTRHTDGVLKPQKGRADIRQSVRDDEFFYVNLQLRGVGHLQIQTDEQLYDEQWLSFRVEPGELYTFDQRMDHAWLSDGNAQCKIFSFALPKSAIIHLANQRAAEVGQPLSAVDIFTFQP